MNKIVCVKIYDQKERITIYKKMMRRRSTDTKWAGGRAGDAKTSKDGFPVGATVNVSNLSCVCVCV